MYIYIIYMSQILYLTVFTFKEILERAFFVPDWNRLANNPMRKMRLQEGRPLLMDVEQLHGAVTQSPGS